MSLLDKIDGFFEIKKSGSSFAIETRAAVTTFVTMVYIIFVNPFILSHAIQIEGKDLFGQLLTTTALAAGIGSCLMGLLARYPFALAPGMGVNAYFAFSVVIGMKIPWQTALGAVFISGILFILLSLFRIREIIVHMIPKDLKYAISAGIGLFLAMIGVQNAGLIVKHEATLVTMGDLSSPKCLIALFGLLLTVILMVYKIRGAVFLGIIASTLLAIFGQVPIFDGKVFQGLSSGIIRAPQWPVDLFLAFDIRDSLNMGVLSIIFVFLFVDFFDTAGSLVGLSQISGLADENQKLKRTTQAFLADAIATVIGACLGTSTVTCYIESASGIKEGGRTGLTAVIVGLLFFMSIFFWPLASAVPGAATAPALIIIGSSMMSHVRLIDWDEISLAFPAFLTLLLMPFTFSIANGITFGILSYVIIKVFTGRFREIPWVLYILSTLLLLRLGYMAS